MDLCACRAILLTPPRGGPKRRCSLLLGRRGTNRAFIDARRISCVPFSRDNNANVAYLFRKDGNVLVERLGRAHVAAGHARLARRARCQLALFENERQQREQRVPVTNKQEHSEKLQSQRSQAFQS